MICTRSVHVNHPTPPPRTITNLYEVRTHNSHNFMHNSRVSMNSVFHTDLIWWSIWAVKTKKVFGWAVHQKKWHRRVGGWSHWKALHFLVVFSSIYKSIALFYRKRTNVLTPINQTYIILILVNAEQESALCFRMKNNKYELTCNLQNSGRHVCDPERKERRKSFSESMFTCYTDRPSPAYTCG